MPFSDGWRHVKSFGFWYGNQMKFKPYIKAYGLATNYATEKNKALKKRISEKLKR